MRKRQMKKWIPKGTPYCHGCKWRTRRNGKAYCLYIHMSDDDLDCGLLWDACKECGEHDTEKDFERDMRRYYKRVYRLSRMKREGEVIESKGCVTCKHTDKEWYEEPCEDCHGNSGYERKEGER